jgi:Asp/Glu/hydantoin racemase
MATFVNVCPCCPVFGVTESSAVPAWFVSEKFTVVRPVDAAVTV